jgi:hypothetical protein
VCYFVIEVLSLNNRLSCLEPSIIFKLTASITMQNSDSPISKRSIVQLLLCCALGLASSAQASPFAAGTGKPNKATGSNEKVLICHNGHDINVSINALQAHLAHGDQVGSCSAGGGTGDVPVILARTTNPRNIARR